MFQKHIKAASLALVFCLIAVMFAIVAITGEIEVAGTMPELVLLIIVAAAVIPVYLLHEKRD